MSKESRDMLEAEFVAANTPDAAKAAALIRDIEKALSATERTAEQERAAIVAWLWDSEKQGAEWVHARELANAIERGDHLTKGNKD